jgi:hypothetical protein
MYEAIKNMLDWQLEKEEQAANNCRVSLWKP